MAKQSRPEGDAVYSVFRNLRPVRRAFGYLGLYGREVSGGGEFVFEGRPEDQPGFNERKRRALARDVLNGLVSLATVPVAAARGLRPPGYPRDRLGRSG